MLDNAQGRFSVTLTLLLYRLELISKSRILPILTYIRCLSQYHFSSNKCPNDYGTLFESLIYFCPTDGLSSNPDFIGGQNAQPHILELWDRFFIRKGIN